MASASLRERAGSPAIAASTLRCRRVMPSRSGASVGHCSPFAAGTAAAWLAWRCWVDSACAGLTTTSSATPLASARIEANARPQAKGWMTAFISPPVSHMVRTAWFAGSLCRASQEQDVVLQVNVLHQVVTQFFQTPVQRAPGITGIGRWRDVVGQRRQLGQCGAVLIMLVTHDGNGAV